MPYIRIANAGDAPQISDIYAPVVLDTVISFEEEPPSAADFEQRISSTLLTHPWLVAEDDSGLMGYAYAAVHRSRPGYRWSADVSVYIAEGHRRRGVGRALYASLLPMLEMQGMYNVYAGIAMSNAGSVGLHESLGFELVGVYERVGFKLGEWVDVGWWELTLGEHAASPVEPLSFSDIRSSDECTQALLAGTQLLKK